MSLIVNQDYTGASPANYPNFALLLRGDSSSESIFRGEAKYRILLLSRQNGLEIILFYCLTTRFNITLVQFPSSGENEILNLKFMAL